MEALAAYFAEAGPRALDAALRWALRIAVALALLLVGLRLVRAVVSRLDERLEALPAFDATSRRFFERAVHALLLVILAVVVLGQLGVTTSSLLALIGGAALAVGLAIQGTLGNLASGIMIMLLRPFAVGDDVEVAGFAGTVSVVTLFNTELRTFDGERLVIPNRQITEAALRNYSHNAARRMVVPVQVAYESDLRRAREVLLAAARDRPEVLDDPEPQVWVAELADSGVTLSLRAWAKSGDSWRAQADLTEAAKTALDAAGIEIPFPQRVVRQGPPAAPPPAAPPAGGHSMPPADGGAPPAAGRSTRPADGGATPAGEGAPRRDRFGDDGGGE